MRAPLASLSAVAAALALAAPAAGSPAAGLNPTGAELLLYDTATPGTILERHPITGLQANEKIVGLDTRPATGQLYALGLVREATDSGRIYVIDPGTGAATQVGAAPFKTDLTPSEYGFDFNPASDRIRVVNRGDDNLRVFPDTGALAGLDTDLTPAGDVDAIAYDQNQPGTPQTTLWGYDSNLDEVVRIGGVNAAAPDGSPNNGKVVAPFGASGIATAGRAEMDIAPGGTAVLTATTTGPTYSLYTVSLTSGTVTLVGNFPEAVEDIALLAPSQFGFAGDVSVPEDAGSAVVTVRRTGNATGTQSVAYSTGDGSATGGDYTATSGTLSFAPGETSKTFSVPIVDDKLNEPDENVVVTLSAVASGAALGAGVGGIRIVDDDGPPDTRKPAVLVAVPSRLTAGTYGRGVRGAFSCSERCDARLVLKLGKRTVGATTARLSSEGVKKFRLRGSTSGNKRVRAALRKRRSVRLRLAVAAKDPAGNIGRASAALLVTR
jgi:hypothetical protein